MPGGVVHSACRSVVEGMSDVPAAQKREAYVDTLTGIIAFVVAAILLAFIGKLLWNNVVVELITVARPARSFWHILGLMIFIGLLRP